MELVKCRVRYFASIFGDYYEIEPDETEGKVWNCKLGDWVSVCIDADEFTERYPGISYEVLEEGEAEANLPISELIGPHDIFVPAEQVEEHEAFESLVQAVADGLWVDPETGEQFELDSEQSPLRRMGLI